MCSIDAYERENKPSRCDDVSSGGGFALPKHSTKEALKSLSANRNCIGCWIKALEHNLLEHFHLYTPFMKELFQKIPVELPNKPSPREKRKS